MEIAGWDQDGTEAALKQQAEALGLAGAVSFAGPQFGAAKDAAYAGADGFVLPSLSEGLPMVVLEAWSHGLPVLMTDACNLPDGFAAGAAHRLRTGTTAEGGRGLADFLTLDGAARQSMGAAGLALARQRYLWTAVAARITAGYAWTLGRADRPDFLHGG